jgi:hypothetical protein
MEDSNIKITYRTTDTPEFIENEIKNWNSLLDQLQKKKVITCTVKEIIVSDNYSSDFKSLVNNNEEPVSKRGYTSVAKRITKDDGEIFLFDRRYTDLNTIVTTKTIINQFVDALIPEIIEKTLPFVQIMRNEFETNNKYLIQKIYNTLVFRHVKQFALKQIKFSVDDGNISAVSENITDFLTIERSLHRDIKKAHFEFQEHKSREQFWEIIIDTLAFHLEQLLLLPQSAVPLEHPLEELLQSFFDFTGKNEPEELLKKIDNKLKDFFSTVNINLTIMENGQYHIEITEHPQNFYKNFEVTDTEERLVCFLDILGFREMIREYDRDKSSTLLQDFKDALDFALTDVIQRLGPQTDLEYKTFSDNVLISTPFYSDDDCYTKLFIITSTIIAFATALLAKGFYVRGGLCIGSYYSDNNMIFSGGLVTSYELETRVAVYPRVVLDDSLVSFISKMPTGKINEFPWDKLFVKDRLDEEVFINVFDSMLEPHKSFKFMQKSIDDAFRDIGDDPFSDSMKNVSQHALNMTLEMININVSKDETITWLKNEILKRISENNDNKYVKKKYLWLLQFVEWLNGENNNHQYLFELIGDDKS